MIHHLKFAKLAAVICAPPTMIVATVPHVHHWVAQKVRHIAAAVVAPADVIAAIPCPPSFAAPTLASAPVIAALAPITLPPLNPTPAGNFAALSTPTLAGFGPSQGLVPGGSFTSPPLPPVTLPGGVPAVPEPAAWAMLATGFGVAGWRARMARKETA